MIFIYGTRLYGKVDEVPGLCHVATRFFHVWFLPLIPVGSYIVVSQGKGGKGSFNGRGIGLDVKSTLVAWGRFGLLIAGGIFSLMGTGLMARPQTMWEGVGLIAAGVLMIAAGVFLWAHRSVCRASYPRAVRLAEKLGLSEEGLVLLELAYGRVTEAEAQETLRTLRADAEELRRLQAGAASAPPTAPVGV
jgi:hypothetical protein